MTLGPQWITLRSPDPEVFEHESTFARVQWTAAARARQLLRFAPGAAEAMGSLSLPLAPATNSVAMRGTLATSVFGRDLSVNFEFKTPILDMEKVSNDIELKCFPDALLS